ncbi:MAG: hypothetical protein COV36_05010 [Alphaproteobacteria bacterium CG11_big_fil_rev_8_21_14_0_20_44_7]|nr:MAG: hypothetical protein COV36_05010 [Alphaproteobacteria bacterium CG11_big_fil_rev_8_21_14_0_20_44_7]
MSSKSKFKAFVKHKASLEAAIEFAAKIGCPENSVIKGDIEDACKALEEDASIDYLLVEIPGKDSQKVFKELDNLANFVDPITRVIVCGQVDELSFYKELIGMGIYEYLLNPVKVEQLEKTLSRKTDSSGDEPKAIAPRDDSQVIAVVGTRGGVGVSTFATNLAGLFAKRDYPTAILDLDPEFGTIPLLVDVEASRGLVDALEKPERVDSLFLDRVMTKVTDSLFVMGAEKSLLERADIDPEAPQKIIDQLRAKFAYVIVDVARVEPYTHYVLQNYETIIMTEYSIAGLRDTMRIYDLVKEQLKNDNVKIVANRVGISKKFQTQRKDFENGLGQKIDFEIPFDADFYGFNNSGKILTMDDKQKSKMADGIAAVAQGFMPESVTDAGAKDKKKKSGGLFSGKKKK